MAAFEANHFFGPAKRLRAESIGRPGERHFRLLVESNDNRSALLWLEKEQLQALGLAAEQLTADVQGSSPAPRPPTAPGEAFPSQPTLEFKIGRLALGQDESELESGPRFVLLAYDVEHTDAEEAEPSGPADLACRLTRGQLRSLSQNVAEVIAGGRPRCPFCGDPVQRADQPHGCVRSNGHHA